MHDAIEAYDVIKKLFQQHGLEFAKERDKYDTEKVPKGPDGKLRHSERDYVWLNEITKTARDNSLGTDPIFLRVQNSFVLPVSPA